ncbi:MAG: hypothetical protein EOO41_05500 [Methanobacteriota archaeon]|nr:MAG: hypothetical protein EOO41_05500 [Euryarchaeota archaeon]
MFPFFNCRNHLFAWLRRASRENDVVGCALCALACAARHAAAKNARALVARWVTWAASVPPQSQSQSLPQPQPQPHRPLKLASAF